MKKQFRVILLVILGWMLSLAVLIPLYILVINSFKTKYEVLADTLGLPAVLSFDNFTEAIKKTNYFRAFGNSLLITVVSVILIIICSSMAAWVLVRNKTRTSRIVFGMIISAMVIPFQTIMIPMIQYYSKWRIAGFSILNSYYGIMFAYVGTGLSMSMFLYHGFIKGVPVELEEAAIIDGCGSWKLFWRVVFPILKPITVTVAILNIIGIWNDYLMPSLFLRSPQFRTLPLSTFYFIGQYTVSWNQAMAFLLLIIMPVVIFYIFAQKHVVKGVIGGAVKS